MVREESDILIIGGGIAGMALGCELSQQDKVIVLEAEAHPGYHSTGRSAAILSDTYENETIQQITKWTREILMRDPLYEAHQERLLKKRGILHIASSGQEALLQAFNSDHAHVETTLQDIGKPELETLIPILSGTDVEGAILEADASDIDASLLMEIYQKNLKANRGTLVTDCPAESCERSGGLWQVHTRHGTFAGTVLVNAAGAWADAIATKSGLPPLGLNPLRRTAITIDMDLPTAHWPMARMLDDSLYFKPEGAGLMISPFDEHLSAPMDAQPEEIDIATAAWRFEKLTGLPVRNIRSQWAGLRNYLSDERPAVGFDTEMPGFFWYAGLGGFGIQTAPALSKLAAQMITGREGNFQPLGRAAVTKAIDPRRYLL